MTKLVVAILAFVPSLVAAGPSTAAGDACPPVPPIQDPRDPVFYDFVSTYRSACASHQNWDRPFDDVTVSRVVDGTVPVSITTSTALAGAVASLRVGGKEYIASGGHGAALQFAFHAWQEGGSASECYNPTQAGSVSDSRRTGPPYHGPSTSALYRMERIGSTIRTASRPAMFIQRADPEPGWGPCLATDFQPDRSPYTLGLSPYWLETSVRMAPDHGLAGLDNVIRLSGSLTSGDDLYDHFDAVLVAYLQRDFTKTYRYDAVTRTVHEFTGDTATGQSPIRCTADGAYCLGLYFRPTDQPGAYYYTMSRAPMPYNGYFGEYTMQMTAPATGIGTGGRTELHYDVYLAVGNLGRVADTLGAVGTQLG